MKYILLGILFILVLITNIKFRNYNSSYTKKEIKLSLLILIIDIIIFLVLYVITKKMFLSFSLVLLILPIDLFRLSINTFKLKEDLSHVSKIYTTKKIDEKLVDKFKNAHIEIVNKEDKKESYYKSQDLNKTYDDIILSRKSYDNYLNSINYLVMISLGFFLSSLFLYFMDYHINTGIEFSLLFIILKYISSRYVFSNNKIHKDIDERYPVKENKMFSKDDIILDIIGSLLVMFIISFIFMYLSNYMVSDEFINTFYYLLITFVNTFLVLHLISDKVLIYNLVKSYKNIFLILFIILSIGVSILVLHISSFGTKNIGVQNYFVCLVISVIFILLLEVVKFVRYINGGSHVKNNKKHRRS